MNNIIPPPQKRPLAPLPEQSVQSPPTPAEVVKDTQIVVPLQPDTPRSKKRLIWWLLGSVLALLIIAAIGAMAWYAMALQPVSGDKTRTRIYIVEGSSMTDIGQLLEEKKLIRSKLAFTMYARLSRTHTTLQVGAYRLSPSESTTGIIDHLTSGKTDQFTLTFLPGATLAENRAALIKIGYKTSEVDAALHKTYNHPLFVDKPVDSDLEGYVYGETYQFDSDNTVEQILTKTFNEYYAALQNNNIIEGFKNQGLNMYQGITLASMIQRELPKPVDQQQAAQIFLKRLHIDMPLGSDVTYQYAAKKLGIVPSPDLDSPYNTRKVTGLPPGPIAVPGLTALEAVANPASGDYLYFLSGDDEATYYGHTSEEHEINIRDHCRVKCSLP